MQPKRRWGVVLMVVLLLGAVVAATVYALPHLEDYLTQSDAESGLLTHTVASGKLIVTVTEDGNVESASNLDVKCQIAGGATILWLVQDGKQVEKGEQVVSLDQSNIEDRLNAQKITYEKALAAKVQAEAEHESAKISVREYEEGTYVKELQEVEKQITIALENLRSAQNLLEHTEVMSRKGFVTPLQLEADRFAVQRAQLELDAANTTKTVLQEFTHAKVMKQLESSREAAAARMRSEQAAYDLEKARLDRLQQQLESCVIKAPQSGMVVYANEPMAGRRGGSPTPAIEEGAMVREGQSILRIPDLTRMQVKVTVHETKVDKMRPGMPARIVIQDRNRTGTVVSVANQPEPGSFFSSAVKEYATVVQINGEATDLRPGMTAHVEILVAELDKVLTVPVHVIVEQRGKFCCWVDKSAGPEKRPVILGASNDKMIEIKDGLLEGDQVILNPRAFLAEAREDASESQPMQETDTKKEFGPGAPVEPPGDRVPGAGTKARPDTSGPPTGAERGPESGRGPQPEGGPQSGRGGPGSGFDPMQSDKDGDGRLSRDEAPERMKEFFDKIDTNGDGFLDSAELAARRRSRGGGPPGGGPPGGSGQLRGGQPPGGSGPPDGERPNDAGGRRE